MESTVLPQPSERDWIAETEQYLKERYHAAIANLPSNLGSDLVIKPKLDVNESKYFLLGVEAGLFSIDDGYPQSAFLPPPSKGERKQKMLQLFWRGKSSRFLFREGVCQLAAASSLVIKHGWDISQIQMEPPIKRFGALAYAVDILIGSPSGNIFVCGEVKSSDREFEKLIRNFRSCCARGKHRKSECECKSNHPKYEMCAVQKPAYFWAVSPGRETCFRLTYDGETILLDELDRLPDRTKIEATQ